jgi:hypothetical protein
VFSHRAAANPSAAATTTAAIELGFIASPESAIGNQPDVSPEVYTTNARLSPPGSHGRSPPEAVEIGGRRVGAERRARTAVAVDMRQGAEPIMIELEQPV